MRSMISCNIEIKAASQVRDLGVDCGAGARRANKVTTRRVGRGNARMHRVKQLWRWSKKTARFQSTNITPVTTFGIAAYGGTDTQMKQMRS